MSNIKALAFLETLSPQEKLIVDALYRVQREMSEEELKRETGLNQRMLVHSTLQLAERRVLNIDYRPPEEESEVDYEKSYMYYTFGVKGRRQI